PRPIGVGSRRPCLLAARGPRPVAEIALPAVGAVAGRTPGACSVAPWPVATLPARRALGTFALGPARERLPARLLPWLALLAVGLLLERSGLTPIVEMDVPGRAGVAGLNRPRLLRAAGVGAPGPVAARAIG